MRMYWGRISKIFLSSMLLTILIVGDVMALNGLIFYGVGPRNRAMGGANGALPVDTSTILTNPAGLGKLGNHVDIGAHYLKAQRFFDTSATTSGVPNAAAGRQNSGQTVYITPFSGVSYKGEDSKWAFGAIIAGVAGEGAKFKQSRINPAVLAGTEEFDTETFLFVIKAAPAASYDLYENLTIGASLQINAAFLSLDLAAPGKTGNAPPFQQTDGSGTLEVSYGYALQVGAIYDLNDKWSVGLAVQDKTRFERFGDYQDIVPDFELPPEVRASLAWHLTPKLDLTFDYKWIGWKHVDLFDDGPEEGGFGWEDQHTFGVGAQYEWSPNLTLRAGANYGRSPIRDDVAFANALSPAVYETSIAAGGEYKIGKTKRNSIAASAVYTLGHVEKDDGSGDLFSQVGEGTRIGYDAGFDFDVAWSIKF